jgi:hypothetical protein
MKLLFIFIETATTSSTNFPPFPINKSLQNFPLLLSHASPLVMSIDPQNNNLLLFTTISRKNKFSTKELNGICIML